MYSYILILKGYKSIFSKEQVFSFHVMRLVGKVINARNSRLYETFNLEEDKTAAM